MSAFDKVERELYPLVNLSYSFPDYVVLMKKYERPDWVKDDKDLGLEITLSQTKHIGYTTSFANRFLGKSKEEIPVNELQFFKGKTYFDENKKLYAVTANRSMDDGWQHICLALESARTKLGKLNGEGFCTCRLNSLYIYTTFSLSIEDCYIFYKEYQVLYKDYTYTYQNIFLCDNAQTVYFDFIHNQIKIYRFSCNEITVMDNDVHELRREKDWNEGDLFIYTPRKIPRGESISYSLNELESNTDCKIALSLYKNRI